jgi:glycosyltransferase involved in cell wall biosynthesis
MMTRCMVVSAVNFTEGGPLTILREFVKAACEELSAEWRIVVFVHDRKLLDIARAQFIEIPGPKTSWLRRLHLEWFGFGAYAKKLKPDLWISLHDVTPRVGTIRQAVYCHNPMPFYRPRLRDIWLEPKVMFFRLFYSILYRVNIRRNYAIVVQQSWLREEFRKWAARKTNLIVSYPISGRCSPGSRAPGAASRQAPIFVYPTLPRVFKNIELICQALQELEGAGDWHSKVVITMDGNENRYARWLWSRYGNLKTLCFAGCKTPQEMRALYESSDCLIFPSLLETWGLPITEAKTFGLPMLIADLPYAHETVGTYSRVKFIDVADPVALAKTMRAFQDGDCTFVQTKAVVPDQPFAPEWPQLLSLLLVGLN